MIALVFVHKQNAGAFLGIAAALFLVLEGRARATRAQTSNSDYDNVDGHVRSDAVEDQASLVSARWFGSGVALLGLGWLVAQHHLPTPFSSSTCSERSQLSGCWRHSTRGPGARIAEDDPLLGAARRRLLSRNGAVAHRAAAGHGRSIRATARLRWRGRIGNAGRPGRPPVHFGLDGDPWAGRRRSGAGGPDPPVYRLGVLVLGAGFGLAAIVLAREPPDTLFKAALMAVPRACNGSPGLRALRSLCAGVWLARHGPLTARDWRLRWYVFAGGFTFLVQFPRLDDFHLIWSACIPLVVGAIALDRFNAWLNDRWHLGRVARPMLAAALLVIPVSPRCQSSTSA